MSCGVLGCHCGLLVGVFGTWGEFQGCLVGGLECLGGALGLYFGCLGSKVSTGLSWVCLGGFSGVSLKSLLCVAGVSRGLGVFRGFVGGESVSGASWGCLRAVSGQCQGYLWVLFLMIVLVSVLGLVVLLGLMLLVMC